MSGWVVPVNNGWVDVFNLEFICVVVVEDCVVEEDVFSLINCLCCKSGIELVVVLIKGNDAEVLE